MGLIICSVWMMSSINFVIDQPLSLIGGRALPSTLIQGNSVRPKWHYQVNFLLTEGFYHEWYSCLYSEHECMNTTRAHI